VSTPRLPDGLLERLAGGDGVVFLTGSGISAESGVPTFRDALTGLWARNRPEELATPEAFRRDPDHVWGWYQARRRGVMAVDPNPGHHALRELESILGKTTLVTQNVDGLHQRAGSRDVLEFHGSLLRDRCSECDHRAPAGDLERDTPPPCPHCGGLMRPDVVWFGEMIPPSALEGAWQAAASCTLFFSIGTSGLVYPAAELAEVAGARGAALCEINTDPTPLSARCDWVLQGRAGEVLPGLVRALSARPGPGGSRQ